MKFLARLDRWCAVFDRDGILVVSEEQRDERAPKRVEWWQLVVPQTVLVRADTSDAVVECTHNGSYWWVNVEPRGALILARLLPEQVRLAVQIGRETFDMSSPIIPPYEAPWEGSDE